MRVGGEHCVHVIHHNAAVAQVAAQGRGHQGKAVIGTKIIGVGFAADKNAHGTARCGHDIINVAGKGSIKRQVDQRFAGGKLHHAGSVGSQGIPHAGNAQKRFRHTRCHTPRCGDDINPFGNGSADGFQRAGCDLFFIIEYGAVQIQCNKTDIGHNGPLLCYISPKILAHFRSFCKGTLHLLCQVW